MKFKNIVKNISYTFIANFVALVVSLFSTLVLPKFVLETDFGYWQLYILYISYAGLLHLGLCDGIYLRYGGKEYREINKIILKIQLKMLVFFVLFLDFFIVFFGGYLANNHNEKMVIGLVGIGAFIHVVRNYFLLILQATNRLKEYSVITIFDRIFFFFFLAFFLLYGLRSYIYLIIADIMGRILSLLISILQCKDICSGKGYKIIDGWKEFKENICAGFPLLISGIAGNFILGSIRLGIENGWDIVVFGKISLSLSVANMVLSFVTMIGIVFFPIVKKMNRTSYAQIFECLNTIIIVVSLGILIFSLPVKEMVSIWLPNYASSMQIMIWILPICIFESEMSILLTTYMKAMRQERVLLQINLSVMFLSIVYTFIFTVLYKNLHATIIGIVLLVGIKTLFSKIYIIHKLEMKWDKTQFVEYIVVAFYMALFLRINEKIAWLFYLIIYILTLLLIKRKILGTFLLIKRRIRGEK